MGLAVNSTWNDGFSIDGIRPSILDRKGCLSAGVNFNRDGKRQAIWINSTRIKAAKENAELKDESRVTFTRGQESVEIFFVPK